MFSLIHTYDAYDYCNDTPLNNNCWLQVTGSPTCDWGNVSNNVMDYNQWVPKAWTPCQIDRATTSLNTTPNSNYIYNCSDCVPANANFVITGFNCGSNPITMDCRGSFNEDGYFIEVFKVSSPSSTTVIAGTYFSSWYTGQVPSINLKTIYTPGFTNGYYRIKLAVQNHRSNNTFCNSWDEETKVTSYTTSCSTPPPPCTGCGGKVDSSETSIDASLAASSLNLYPNPNNGSFNIELIGYTGNAIIEAFDLNGSRIFSSTVLFNHSFVIDLNNVATGIYQLKFTTENFSTYRKFIITK